MSYMLSLLHCFLCGGLVFIYGCVESELSNNTELFSSTHDTEDFVPQEERLQSTVPKYNSPQVMSHYTEEYNQTQCNRTAVLTSIHDVDAFAHKDMRLQSTLSKYTSPQLESQKAEEYNRKRSNTTEVLTSIHDVEAFAHQEERLQSTLHKYTSPQLESQKAEEYNRTRSNTTEVLTSIHNVEAFAHQEEGLQPTLPKYTSPQLESQKAEECNRTRFNTTEVLTSIHDMEAFAHQEEGLQPTLPKYTSPQLESQKAEECNRTRFNTTEVLTSIHDMVAFAHQEGRLLSIVHKYISPLLKLLKEELEQLLKFRPPELTVEELIGDPIRALTLVRRLTRDWRVILNSVIDNVGNITEIQDELVLLPEEHVLESAKRTLIRLQEVYNLDSKQLAYQSENVKLTALDCFDLGKTALWNKKFKISLQWFREAIEKDASEGNAIGVHRLMTLLVVAELFTTGCVNGTRSPREDKNLLFMMSRYQSYASDGVLATLKKVLPIDCSVPKWYIYVEKESQKINQDFNRVCRGYNTSNSSELRCFYIHYNNPRLLIAPFKMEEQNLDPPILMFHDVITDQEIADMKKEYSKVRIRCPLEQDAPEKYRLCDMGWVHDDAIAASARLTRRVGDMTNLNMESSEEHQVASYGLGGEYLLHVDPSYSWFRNYTGSNRLATLMFYLNDVDGGGYTAFPVLNVAVKPRKGSAVFWFNIDHESREMSNMLHGACPVRRGSKWVITKWIHEGKQTSDIFCPTDMEFPKPRYYLNKPTV